MTDSTRTNVADLLREAAAARPDAVAFIDATTGREITWATLDSAVDAMAHGLRRHGLAAGDRVAVLLGNRIEFVATYFSTLRAGMVSLPLNTAYTEHEVGDLLSRAGARLLVTDEGNEAVAVAAAAVSGTEVVVVGDRSYEGIVRAGLRADAHVGDAEPTTTDPESTAVLLFTSGTSGPAKGAMLSHRALLANVAQPAAVRARADRLGRRRAARASALPHLCAQRGARPVRRGRRDLRAGAEVLADQRAGDCSALRRHQRPGSPAGLRRVGQGADLDHQLAGVRTLVSGAAPLAPAVFSTFADIAGQPVWEGYGMTEASPVVSSTMVGRRPKPGCVGAPLPGVEIRFVDESGEESDEDDPGEILVRGANLFSGYWPDGEGGPDAEGWYATGDVGYLDSDGDLHLVDRRRDLILVSGFNVYPFEIETVISTLPEVAEVAVIGVPNESTGETVKAYVVPLPGHTLTREQVAAHCEKRLARFKCPTIIDVVDTLPHSSTGKIAKAQLRGPDA